jgi:hypothetical protein
MPLPTQRQHLISCLKSDGAACENPLSGSGGAEGGAFGVVLPVGDNPPLQWRRLIFIVRGDPNDHEKLLRKSPLKASRGEAAGVSLFRPIGHLPRALSESACSVAPPRRHGKVPHGPQGRGSTARAHEGKVWEGEPSVEPLPSTSLPHEARREPRPPDLAGF